MIQLRSLFARLRHDTVGAVVIEFALLGPALIVMLLGVLQVGMGLQSYNAMRSLSADIARYAMVQYQTGNQLSNSQIRAWGRNHGRAAPYLFTSTRLDVIVEDAATQRVTGAKELTITVTYEITSVLEFIGIDGPELDFERPVFLLDESTT